MITLNSNIAFSNAKPGRAGRNQDAILPLRKTGNGWVMAVADGVGSYDGADIISNLIVDSISEKKELSHLYLQNLLLSDIKDVFLEKIGSSVELSKAATTLTVCFLDRTGLSVWHVGDCRCYLRKSNKLVQITSDHTQYQRLLDAGIYSKRELNTLNINKNQLTTAVAKWIDIIPNIDFFPLQLLKETYGDTLDIILMSDGAYHFWDLRKRFSDSTMIDIVKLGNSLKRRIERVEPIDDYSVVAASFDLTMSE